MKTKRTLSLALAFCILIGTAVYTGLSSVAFAEVTPILLKTGEKMFSTIHNSQKVVMTDSTSGVTYIHVTPTTDTSLSEKQINFDTGFSCIPTEKMYFKALVRTNVKGTPCANPKIDGKFLGNLPANAPLSGNGSWEEVYVNVGSMGDTCTQCWCFLMGYSAVKNYASDAYLDVAAWGLFESLESATVYSFFDSVPVDKYVPDTLVMPNETTETDANSPITLPFGSMTYGVCNGADSATVTKNVAFEGKTAVKLVPNPNATGANTVNLDSAGLDKYKVKVPDYKYISVSYFYDTDKPSFDGKMKLTLLPGSTGSITALTLESKENVVTGKWATAVFSASGKYALNASAEKPYIGQIHCYPFGGSKPEILSENDVVYIESFTFYTENPDPNATYSATFSSENPDVEGTPPESVSYKEGDIIKLPPCTFTLDNYCFKSWKGIGGKSYSAGEEFVCPDSDVLFEAVWEKDSNVLGDFLTADFAKLDVVISSGGDAAKVYETSQYDGRSVLKIVPNPKAVKSKGLNVDGTGYQSLGVDFDVYKWIVVSYRYESETPVDGAMRINVMNNAGMLSNAYGKSASEKLKVGEWAYASFDMTDIDGYLTPDTPHLLKQLHFYPFGDAVLCSSLSESETMYLNQIMFFKEKPKLETIDAYMTGYSDGSFKPNKTMSRAEACTVIARLIANGAEISGTASFGDVASDSWYARYIGFCEEKGLLKSYSGDFLPENAITRAEFAELVYNTNLSDDTGKEVSFTDITESHPKYASIKAAASAGLITGYSNGTFLPDRAITRAQVVTIINRARGRDMTLDCIPSDIVVVFTDVDNTNWAFANIAESAVPHVSLNGSWVYAISKPATLIADKIKPDFEEGFAKVAEIDRLTEERKVQIRASSSKLSGITGRTYYVSNSGSDANDGLSPSTAWATPQNSAVRSGDGVLFERGGTWRIRFTAKSGVTYSAYGEGDKPKIYGSPENGADPKKWMLYHEDVSSGMRIWKYSNENMNDIGSVTFDGGKAYGKKLTPRFFGGKFIEDDKTDFNVKVHLTKNFCFFHEATSAMSADVPNASTATGALYLRCDRGNPGELFKSVEFGTRGNIISIGGENVTIDNLCIMYGGSHGIGSGTVKGLTVTNCEIGMIGGSIQSYNFRNTKSGEATRFGNGVQIYGGCDGYIIENCYVYQCYDAGITHQLGTSAVEASMYDIVYRGNVIEDCTYNIEYWLGEGTGGIRRDGKNYLVENNIFRRAGYGFGATRPNGNLSGHIKTWAGSRNEFVSYVIKDNIFDRSTHTLFQIDAWYKAWLPRFEGNTFIQGWNDRFAVYGLKGGVTYTFDIFAETTAKKLIGDETACVYFVEPIPKYVFPAEKFNIG